MDHENPPGSPCGDATLAEPVVEDDLLVRSGRDHRGAIPHHRGGEHPARVALEREDLHPGRRVPDFAVLSELAVTMRWPSGNTAAERTPPVWPSSVHISVPSSASHTFAVLSSLAVTMRKPSGNTAAEYTLPAWPSSVMISVPSSASHTFAVLS